MADNVIRAFDSEPFNRETRDDSGAYPMFSVEAVRNNHKSERESRPIYDEVEFVRIIMPGDRKTVFFTKVREQDKLRWPREYEAFQKGLSPLEVGTPLTQWPGFPKALAAILLELNVRTIEQLAKLPDTHIDKVMEGHSLRAKAQTYLAATNADAMHEALESAKAMQSRLDALEEQLRIAQSALATHGTPAQIAAAGAGGEAALPPVDPGAQEGGGGPAQYATGGKPKK